MAEQLNRVCDGCGEVVHGKVKAAFVSRDYLEIKGAMVLQIAATRTSPSDHVYLTKKFDGVPPALIFCRMPGFPCLEQYINGKMVFVNGMRERALRSEATFSHLKDLAHPDFVIGHKK